MSVNSSSNLSSIDTYYAYDVCLMSRMISLYYIIFYITSILLLLPLCIFILYLGLQRWRQQRSTTTSAISHSDSFTYHMVVMELFGVFGYFLCCCGTFMDHNSILLAGYYFWSFTWYGESFFHTLTCMERYLAVVHPVTYLSLRGERGIRVRNISVGCVWLLSVGETNLYILGNTSFIVDLCILIFNLIIISFCSLSVLCVLIRPRPGEQGGDRERVDQSKKRAFYTIVAILGVLGLRCVWNIFFIVVSVVAAGRCVHLEPGILLNLPCSLVLPLLFLLRAGTFTCCKKEEEN